MADERDAGPAGDADLTGMLAAASGGDAAAAEQLVGLVYDELRRRAEALMQRESPGATVQATMLVHDAYLKLIKQDRASWADRVKKAGVDADQALKELGASLAKHGAGF